MTSKPESRMVAVDGTDALAYVILRPGSNPSGVVIEAAASGISKPYAAYALRHTAQSWDPDDSVGQDVGEQLKEALAEVARLRADLATARAAAPLLVAREDLTELAAILDAERYRLDKGDGSPVPQPRWGANVRISQAVQAALAAPACSCRAEVVHQAGCDA